MPKRNLLTDFEMALQDYSNALSEAQNPALTPDERIELLRAAQPLWDRIQAISRAIEQRTAGELHAGDAPEFNTALATSVALFGETALHRSIRAPRCKSVHSTANCITAQQPLGVRGAGGGAYQP